MTTIWRNLVNYSLFTLEACAFVCSSLPSPKWGVYPPDFDSLRLIFVKVPRLVIKRWINLTARDTCTRLIILDGFFLYSWYQIRRFSPKVERRGGIIFLEIYEKKAIARDSSHLFVLSRVASFPKAYKLRLFVIWTPNLEARLHKGFFFFNDMFVSDYYNLIEVMRLNLLCLLIMGVSDVHGEK